MNYTQNRPFIPKKLFAQYSPLLKKTATNNQQQKMYSTISQFTPQPNVHMDQSCQSFDSGDSPNEIHSLENSSIDEDEDFNHGYKLEILRISQNNKGLSIQENLSQLVNRSDGNSKANVIASERKFLEQKQYSFIDQESQRLISDHNSAKKDRPYCFVKDS